MRLEPEISTGVGECSEKKRKNPKKKSQKSGRRLGVLSPLKEKEVGKKLGTVNASKA